MLAPMLLLAALLWLAALAGCDSDAPAGPSPLETEIPVSPTAGAPSETLPPARTATPGHTPAARPAASPTAPAPGVVASEPADHFPTPPERDYYQLARELIPGINEVDRAARGPATTLKVGHRETFRLVDLQARKQYESDFELRLVTPHAYWFIEDGIEVDQESLEQSANEFEDSIYPTVTGVFGTEWKPGVDGDPHLYVVNANLRGVGGYFNSADEYPSAIRPVSNEIEAIYINVRYLPPGTELYSQVLAHELQHAVHWNADVSEETWVNEGLSELAVAIAGYREPSILEFRRAGPTSLVHWPPNDSGGGKNYGAASLFMQYFTEHYGGRNNLRPLLTEPGDGIAGIDSYLESKGYDARFTDVFRDWAVANLIDEDDGSFGYSDLPISFPVYRRLKGGDELASTIPQYANEYILLEPPPSPAVLSFDGDTTVPLLPVDIGEGCWWSNKGDVIDSTLTANLDLRQVDSAILDFQVWFSIEEEWDFAYLEVSEDGGRTWTILETSLTSSEDPLDVSFGPGYTGSTDGWQDESVSLEEWAGQAITVRFQYITDAAIHDHGLCLRDLTVADDDSALPAEWTAKGFVWTNNLVRQKFTVQIIYEGKGDSPNRVLPMELDSRNRGEMTLESDDDAHRMVAVVQSLAPSTRMPASYTVSLQAAH